jgi:hypothetical protein
MIVGSEGGVYYWEKPKASPDGLRSPVSSSANQARSKPTRQVLYYKPLRRTARSRDGRGWKGFRNYLKRRYSAFSVGLMVCEMTSNNDEVLTCSGRRSICRVPHVRRPSLDERGIGHHADDVHAVQYSQYLLRTYLCTRGIHCRFPRAAAASHRIAEAASLLAWDSRRRASHVSSR